MSWEEYRDTAQEYRDGIRKARAQLEINLSSFVMDNNKGFLSILLTKGEQKYSTALVNETGNLMTTDMEKADNLFPRFSLAIAHSVSFKATNLKAGTRGMKSHSSQGKIRFVTI